MSVLKLLATGKSLIGMKDRATPYRMRSANLLPKFESSKNPFVSTAKVEVAETAATPVTIPHAATSCGSSKTAAMETLSLFGSESPVEGVATHAHEKQIATVHPVIAFGPKEIPPAPMMPESSITPNAPAIRPASSTKVIQAQPAPQPAVRQVPAKAPVVTKSFPIMKWAKKLNPFALMSLKRTEGGNSRARAPRPVQAELSLERVKVICNDLSDADLEVVPARQTASPEMIGPRQPAAAETSNVKPLNRLTARLFNAGHTQAH